MTVERMSEKRSKLKVREQIKGISKMSKVVSKLEWIGKQEIYIQC